jgi:hypothetical protein
MRKPLAAIVGMLMIMGVVFAISGGAPVARAAVPGHHIHHAYRLLRRAHYVLVHGCRRLGGHREAALRQVDMGINELRLAIAAGHGALPAIAEGGGIKATPGQLHPYMHDALRQCREAKAELAAATHDFGGHRVKASQHVDAAIAQLEQAVKAPACH